MNSEDIPIEDIVLLQLFKDNLLTGCSLEQTKGIMSPSGPYPSDVTTLSQQSQTHQLSPLTPASCLTWTPC